MVSRLKCVYPLIDFKCSGILLKSLLPAYPNDFWPCTVLSDGIFTLPDVRVISVKNYFTSIRDRGEIVNVQCKLMPAAIYGADAGSKL